MPVASSKATHYFLCSADLVSRKKVRHDIKHVLIKGFVGNVIIVKLRYNSSSFDISHHTSQGHFIVILMDPLLGKIGLPLNALPGVGVGSSDLAEHPADLDQVVIVIPIIISAKTITFLVILFVGSVMAGVLSSFKRETTREMRL